MTDVAVRANAVQTVPAGYKVPGAQEIIVKSVRAVVNGASASGAFVAVLQLVDPNGNVVWQSPTDTTIAAGGSADVSWFPGVARQGKCTCNDVGVIVETLLLDTRSSTGVTSSTVLASGQEYIITAQGTFSYVNHDLDVGSPNADAIFPTSGGLPRVSTQVGFDPECIFAFWSGSPPSGIGHATNNFQINLGSGFQYVTPQDGPHSTPSPNNLYSYKVVGQGNTASFIFQDAPGQYADNYGYIQVTIQTVNGSGGGGGGGALLPPTGSNNSLLRVLSGVPAWAAQPDIAEADFTFTDITTANVSTTKHGLTPKLPNDATKFLDGTGAYSLPSGTSPLTTKGDLFGYSTVNARVPIGGDGQVLTADSTQTLGLKWQTSPASGGAEIGYDQITGNVNVTGTTEGGATTIITCGSHTFDGAAAYAEFGGVVAPPTTSGGNVVVLLTESGTTVEWFGFLQNATAGAQIVAPWFGKFRFTPSAGNHSYVVKAFCDVTTGTPRVIAGTGGTGNQSPAFVRFVKA